MAGGDDRTGGGGDEMRGGVVGMEGSRNQTEGGEDRMAGGGNGTEGKEDRMEGVGRAETVCNGAEADYSGASTDVNDAAGYGG